MAKPTSFIEKRNQLNLMRKFICTFRDKNNLQFYQFFHILHSGKAQRQ